MTTDPPPLTDAELDGIEASMDGPDDGTATLAMPRLVSDVRRLRAVLTSWHEHVAPRKWRSPSLSLPPSGLH